GVVSFVAVGDVEDHKLEHALVGFQRLEAAVTEAGSDLAPVLQPSSVRDRLSERLALQRDLGVEVGASLVQFAHKLRLGTAGKLLDLDRGTGVDRLTLAGGVDGRHSELILRVFGQIQNG